jgi:hypothetical protein
MYPVSQLAKAAHVAAAKVRHGAISDTEGVHPP